MSKIKTSKKNTGLWEHIVLGTASAVRRFDDEQTIIQGLSSYQAKQIVVAHNNDIERQN